MTYYLGCLPFTFSSEEKAGLVWVPELVLERVGARGQNLADLRGTGLEAWVEERLRRLNRSEAEWAKYFVKR